MTNDKEGCDNNGADKLDHITSTNPPATEGCSGKDSPGVPLRLRQLPASFWKEPNRPKAHPLAPLSSLTLAYIGQNHKIIPSNLPVSDRAYRDVVHSAMTWEYPGKSMCDYLSKNNISKYQPIPTKTGEYNTWNSLLLPEDGHKATSRFQMAHYQNPYQINLETQGRMYRGLDYGHYPVPSSNVPSVPWDGVNFGQYPSYSTQQYLSPWRPLPSKTSSSYPNRYHPFSV